jgi:ribosomal protein L33
MDNKYHFCEGTEIYNVFINKDNEYDTWVMEVNKFCSMCGEGIKMVTSIKYCPFCNKELE